MKAIAEDLASGEKIEVDIPDENLEELESLAKDRVSDAKLQGYIDNLDLSADAKALIASILEKAVKVGELVIRVGKRIVEIVILIASKFPNATFGLILGLLVGALVSSIPIIGGLLGAFVLPIAAAFGLATGYMNDFRDQNLSQKIAAASAMFNPLNGEAHVVG
jgi:uncharacterized protein YacL